MQANNSKISNETFSKMFKTEISPNYTLEDIENAQFVYLSSGNCSVEHLCTFKSKCPDILVETLVILYDNFLLMYHNLSYHIFYQNK